MAPYFPIGTAQIVLLFMESVFYGIFLVSFGGCLHVLLTTTKQTRNPSTITHYIMIATASLMFVDGTIDVALGLVRDIQAFINAGSPAGADELFGDISSWVNVAKVVTYLIQSTAADSVLVYRCFLIYNRSWLVISFPLFLLIAQLATWIVQIYSDATLHKQALISSTHTPFLKTAVAAQLVQNVMTTGMIVYNIWSHHQRTRKLLSSISTARSHLVQVIRVIVESGLVYTVSVLITFIAWLTNSNSDYALSSCVVQIIGISFNLIIIRGRGILSIRDVDAPRSVDSRTDKFPLTTISSSRRIMKDTPDVWLADVSDKIAGTGREKTSDSLSVLNSV